MTLLVRLGAALALLASAASCSSEPAYLGTSAEILWWTDHETGDFSDWSTGDGKMWTTGGGSVAIAATHVRSGSHALRSLSDTTDPNELSAGIAIREGLRPDLTCYSAWYYVPSLFNTNKVWLFFKFRSRTQASDVDTSVESWDVHVVANGDGRSYLALYNHQQNSELAAKDAFVPVERWFQVEACLLASTGVDGRLSIWLEDSLVFDIEGQPTLPSKWVEWNVGNVAQGTSPTTGSVFVDDAAISTRRLGPDYPIFWRKAQ